MTGEEHMEFEDWWASYIEPAHIYTLEETAKWAWYAGVQEGIDRMYKIYDICPECETTHGNHKLDCSRGRA